jgi:archaeal type IV pilus assembly protein PilA
MIPKREDAVSPVVGVMLMLVVVIIIAAVVSAFAGGTVAGTKKAPQATISAKFSQGDGMQISHTGGDILNTGEIFLVVKPTKSFGNYDQLSWEINKSVLWTNDKNWVNSSVTSSYKLARTFQPGETTIIKTADLPWIQEKNGATTDYDNPGYGFGNVTYSIGNSFVLYVNDQNGKPITSTEVTIEP